MPEWTDEYGEKTDNWADFEMQFEDFSQTPKGLFDGWWGETTTTVRY